MGALAPFLKAIPAAAESPYALVAYLISALLFLALLYKRTRVKSILKVLRDLPEHDRKPTIEATLNVKLPSKISASQWLKYQRYQFIFLGSMGVLVSVVTIIVVALVLKQSAPQAAAAEKKRKIEMIVQLWPDPKIAKHFLQTPDARLYLKVQNNALGLEKFVPTPDFLETKEQIDGALIGQPVELTIAPREKYSIRQTRRYLTQVFRIEVFSLGKNVAPVPVTKKISPSGDRVLATSDLPVSSDVTPIHADAKGSSSDLVTGDVSQWLPQKSYILDFKGTNLTTDMKVEVVDENGKPVEGAWAGNEPGVANGAPIEVATTGNSFKVYFGVPEAATGQHLFLNITRPNYHQSLKLAGFVVAPSDSTTQ